ncbi:hypothetical protein D3C87_1312720 [compost metagenome]
MVGAKICQAGQTDAVSVGEPSHRDILQHVIFQVLAPADRGVVVATAIARRTRADAAGDLLARRAQCQVDAQVDPAIALTATAETARPVEQRQPPVAIAAEQRGALIPAQVQADAFDVALAVGYPGVDRTFAAEPMVQRQG